MITAQNEHSLQTTHPQNGKPHRRFYRFSTNGKLTLPTLHRSHAITNN